MPHLADRNRYSLADIHGQAIDFLGPFVAFLGIEQGQLDIPARGAGAADRTAFDVDLVQLEILVAGVPEDLGDLAQIGRRVINGPFLWRQP